MQGHEVQLYAILLDGALNRYSEVKVTDERHMPSGGRQRPQVVPLEHLGHWGTRGKLWGEVT